MTYRPSSSGNAFIYILLAVALLGGLTYVLSKSSENNPGTELSDAATKAAATQIIVYAAQAQMAVDRMISNGTSPDDINFTMPWEPTFNTAPTINKLFHPDGGGLQWKALPTAALHLGYRGTPGYSMASAYRGYYIGRFNQQVSTPSSAFDIVFSAHGVNPAVCREINRKITGTAATYTASESDRRLWVDAAYHTGNQANVTAANCPNCVDRPALCVLETFYSILVAR